MDFVEYFKESVEKVENEEGILRMITSNDEFIIHKKCFCDYQEDFVIIYDNGGDVNIIVRYDCIDSLRYISKEQLENIGEEHAKKLFHEFLEKMMKE